MCVRVCVRVCVCVSSTKILCENESLSTLLFVANRFVEDQKEPSPNFSLRSFSDFVIKRFLDRRSPTGRNDRITMSTEDYLQRLSKSCFILLQFVGEHWTIQKNRESVYGLTVQLEFWR